MKHYYTSLEINNDGYVGAIYDSNTNQPIYKTQNHTTQQDANKDLTTYLQTNNAPSKQESITDTIPKFKRRACCGRG
jgi:hypothetical protein